MISALVEYKLTLEILLESAVLTWTGLVGRDAGGASKGSMTDATVSNFKDAHQAKYSPKLYNAISVAPGVRASQF